MKFDFFLIITFIMVFILNNKTSVVKNNIAIGTITLHDIIGVGIVE